MPALVAQSLSKLYAVSGGGELRVLVDASLTLERGENCAVVGPSGSGKSTLLAILGTLDRPTDGTIELCGTAPSISTKLSLPRFAAEASALYSKITIYCRSVRSSKTCSCRCWLMDRLERTNVSRATKLIDRVGLSARANHRPAELSGGERQRAALARALIREPTLLLADEPTGNLDRSTAAAMVELLLEMQREHNAILVAVTHSSALAACMQRSFELDGGRLLPAAEITAPSR